MHCIVLLDKPPPQNCILQQEMEGITRFACCFAKSSSRVFLSGASSSAGAPASSRRRIPAMTTSIFPRSSASRFGSTTPILSVPLKSMCSRKWAIPVYPARSADDPVRTARTQAVWGAPGRFKANTLSPLSSTLSSTVTGNSPAATGGENRKAAKSRVNTAAGVLTGSVLPEKTRGRTP